jgi:hypothetical protein
MFTSEQHLLEVIATHDSLLREVAAGRMNFHQFYDAYNVFYAFYALDGHESDEDERALLDRHHALIEPHRVVAEEILSLVCADNDAELETYKQAGRIGSAEAVRRIKQVISCP